MSDQHVNDREDTTVASEGTNEREEQALYSRRDHWSVEYAAAVENGFEGSEDAYWELNGIPIELSQEGKELEDAYYNPPITPEQTRIEALEVEVEQLKERLENDHKEHTKNHGQFLMLLGDTLLKQGQRIVQSVTPATTSVKLVPQEEAFNEGTTKVILDGDNLTIYRIVDNTLVPHQDDVIDEAVIIAKLKEHAIPDGSMVNMNIYLSRG